MYLNDNIKVMVAFILCYSGKHFFYPFVSFLCFISVSLCMRQDIKIFKDNDNEDRLTISSENRKVYTTDIIVFDTKEGLDVLAKWILVNVTFNNINAIKARLHNETTEYVIDSILEFPSQHVPSLLSYEDIDKFITYYKTL